MKCDGFSESCQFQGHKADTGKIQHLAAIRHNDKFSSGWGLPVHSEIMASNTKPTFLDKRDNMEMGIFFERRISWGVPPKTTCIIIRQSAPQNRSVHSWAQPQTICLLTRLLGIHRHIFKLKFEYHYSILLGISFKSFLWPQILFHYLFHASYLLARKEIKTKIFLIMSLNSDN